MFKLQFHQSWNIIFIFTVIFFIFAPETFFGCCIKSLHFSHWHFTQVIALSTSSNTAPPARTGSVIRLSSFTNADTFHLPIPNSNSFAAWLFYIHFCILLVVVDVAVAVAVALIAKCESFFVVHNNNNRSGKIFCKLIIQNNFKAEKSKFSFSHNGVNSFLTQLKSKVRYTLSKHSGNTNNQEPTIKYSAHIYMLVCAIHTHAQVWDEMWQEKLVNFIYLLCLLF